MLYFENDYSEGAHPRVLQALIASNEEELSGYGSDIYSERAKQKIKELCGCPDGQVYLLVGGTQTNQVVIDSLLDSYQGVIAPATGHVSLHEAGAIELTGHKVLNIDAYDGKLRAEDLKDYMATFYGDANHEHMVFPGMVYISHPTEYGTLYSKKELEALSKICHEYHMALYLDGARLGYGIMSGASDVDLKTIATYCDAFYIGGTKVGALCGEAVVFPRAIPAHYMTIIKQHGALLAKGRLVGVQFDALFSDDLYFKISRNAIETASLLKQGLKEKGYQFYINSPTNQQFVILDNDQYKALEKEVKFSFWQKYDEHHTVVRFATSWATKKADVEKLLGIL